MSIQTLSRAMFCSTLYHGFAQKSLCSYSLFELCTLGSLIIKYSSLLIVYFYIFEHLCLLCMLIDIVFAIAPLLLYTSSSGIYNIGFYACRTLEHVTASLYLLFL